MPSRDLYPIVSPLSGVGAEQYNRSPPPLTWYSCLETDNDYPYLAWCYPGKDLVENGTNVPVCSYTPRLFHRIVLEKKIGLPVTIFPPPQPPSQPS
jgi:hypothetical protein